MTKEILTMDDFCGCIPREEVRDFLLKFLTVGPDGCMANLCIGEDSLANLVRDNAEMAGYVILQLLEDRDVIDHGISIRCPILMNDGPEVVAQLRDWKEAND